MKIGRHLTTSWPSSGLDPPPDATRLRTSASKRWRRSARAPSRARRGERRPLNDFPLGAACPMRSKAGFHGHNHLTLVFFLGSDRVKWPSRNGDWRSLEGGPPRSTLLEKRPVRVNATDVRWDSSHHEVGQLPS